MPLAASCLQPEKVRRDPLNILARPVYTKHFHRCCIKPVKGLFVSHHFNSSISTSPLRYQSTATRPLTRHRTAALGRRHAFQYLDAKDDKSSPGTGEGGRCDTADADSVSRRADIVRPFCSREVVTKRRYTTRNNQNFTSEKFAKALPVDFEVISDAELPRFTFGRVLQRPAGMRAAPIERVIERLL
jgi:hypothetical protein